MTMTIDSALEAFAHCCTAGEVVKYLEALLESGKERLRASGHLALPLVLEFNKDSARVLEILLDSRLGIQVNFLDQDGNTVLYLAVMLQDTQAARLFLARADLNPNVRNRHGDTPLHVAVAGASSPDGLKILISLLSDSRVNVCAVTAQKRNALHVACMSKHPHVDVIRMVIRSAARSVKTSLLQFLLSPDESGRTPLHYAAEKGLQEIVDEILSSSQVSEGDSGQLVLARDATGCLAVHLAAQNGHLSVVKRLLKHFKDGQSNGLPLLRCAVRSGRNDVVELCLKEYTISLTEYLELLSLTTHLNIADFLLAQLQGALVNVKDSTMKPLMQWAVKDLSTGALVIPHVLKWHPDQANEVLNGAEEQTGLHIATILGNAEAVKALCSEGAPWDLRADKRDVHDLTALDYAFLKENKAVQRILKTRPDVREYLAQLHKNRETYVKAANAILVVAALIATLTYAKCTTDAETDKELNPDRKDFLEYATTPPRWAFFLATLSCLLAAIAALPFSFGLVFVQTTDDKYVRRSTKKTRLLVISASYCLVLSLGAVLVSFICSQYVLPFLAFNCAKACKWAVIAFVLLSALLLSANAVMAFIWPTWKKNCSRRLRDCVDQVLPVMHPRRGEKALDKKQSQELVQRAAEEAGDVKSSQEV